MLLSELYGGDRFRIVKVTAGEAIGKRLVDMGLNQGVEGAMVRCAMLGDPIQIWIRGYNLSLRLSEAAGVEVELIGRMRPHGRRWPFGPGRGRGHHGMGHGPGRHQGRGRGEGRHGLFDRDRQS